MANKNGDWFAFLFAEPRCRVVAHNATLGESFFYDRANERQLLPVVGEAEAGLTFGRGGFSLTYSAVISTREYEHQNHKQSYGNIRFDYTWAF